MTQEVDDFLAHFGVKGMHWGVRKDTSTGSTGSSPKLSRAAVKTAKAAATQAVREQKAQKYLAKASAFQKQLNTMKASKPTSEYEQRLKAIKIKDLTAQKDRALSDAERKRQGKLSSTQKKVVIGASIAAALITTAVVVDQVQSGNFNRLALKGKAFMNGEKDAVKLLKANADLSQKFDANGIMENVVKDINPDYGSFGSKVNCRRCTFAYELRRRGYDVAATRTSNGRGQTANGLLNAIHPGRNEGTSTVGTLSTAARDLARKVSSRKNPDLPAKPTILLDALERSAQIGGDIPVKEANAAGILAELLKQPNGSRGELGVMWKVGGGHSMAYEIIDGVPHVFDTQVGKDLSTAAELAGHGLDNVKGAALTRLDDKVLNNDYLLRWVKNNGK